MCATSDDPAPAGGLTVFCEFAERDQEITYEHGFASPGGTRLRDSEPGQV